MISQRIREALQARGRLFKVILGILILFLTGVLPGPIDEPARFLARGGFVGGFVSLGMAVLVGGFGFWLFGVDVSRKPTGSFDSADFAPEVPPAAKDAPPPAWRRFVFPLLVLFLTLILLPRDTGVPRVLGMGLLLGFTVVAAGTLAAGIGLSFGRLFGLIPRSYREDFTSPPDVETRLP